ncbi:Glutathione synthase [Gracilaria domingensis]|nr:Glutathione synthase [Gracilaria domingensis]
MIALIVGILCLRDIDNTPRGAILAFSALFVTMVPSNINSQNGILQTDAGRSMSYRETAVGARFTQSRIDTRYKSRRISTLWCIELLRITIILWTNWLQQWRVMNLRGVCLRCWRALTTSPQQRRAKFSICRYDYFMHVGERGEYCLRMVEMNCIAARYGCLGTKISQLQCYLSSHPVSNVHISLKHLPQTDALHALQATLATAHKALLDVCAPDSSTPVVLVMVVQPGDTHSYDQDLLRQTL